MPESSRTAILERLRRVRASSLPDTGHPAPQPDTRLEAAGQDARLPVGWKPALLGRLTKLRRMMEAVKTEFLEADPVSWPETIRSFLAREGVRTLLYGRGTNISTRIEGAFASGEPRLVAYDHPIDEWKAELFASIDAAITTTRGGIADTGSLILWPTPAEPRLMSLVPPIHVALLDPATIHESFADAIRDERWAAGMPPNALLISGPSKTADIEQTLAYGVHGPKRLVVVVVRDGFGSA